MRRAERIARVEAQLVAACAMARRRGYAIVCETFEAEGAVCALGAANLCRVDLDLARGPGERLDSEWDSIEMGFDAVPLRTARKGLGETPLDVDFYRLGARVRRAVKPVRAALLGTT